MGDLVTYKFPDGNFTRPRLAVFALPAANKNIAAAFKSLRNVRRHVAHRKTIESSREPDSIVFVGGEGLEPPTFPV